MELHINPEHFPLSWWLYQREFIYSIFLPKCKLCHSLLITIITQRIVLKKSQRARKEVLLSQNWEFYHVSLCLQSNMTKETDSNQFTGSRIIYLVVWYTRHDSGRSTIIKERLKQLYIMLKHSLFPSQTDGPGLQAVLDHLDHDNNQISPAGPCSPRQCLLTSSVAAAQMKFSLDNLFSEAKGLSD